MDFLDKLLQFPWILVLLLPPAGYVGYVCYLVFRELSPTLKHIESLNRTVKATTEQASEISPHIQSISQNIAMQREAIQELTACGREVVVEISRILSVRQPALEALSLVRIWREQHDEFHRSRFQQMVSKANQKYEMKAKLSEIKDRAGKMFRSAGEKIRTRFAPLKRSSGFVQRTVPFIFGAAAGGFIAYVAASRSEEPDADLEYEYARYVPSLPEVRPQLYDYHLPDVEVPEKEEQRNEADRFFYDLPPFRYPSQLKHNLKIMWALLKRAYQEWNEDHAPEMGASLAYYTIFSLSPLLIIVISIAGFLFGQEAAQGQIVRQVADVVGMETAQAVEELIKSAQKPGHGIVATIVGILTLLFGATGVFVQLQSALDRIWEIPPKNRGWFGLITERFSSFNMVLAIGFLLLVSLVLSASISAVGKYFANYAAFAFALQIVEAIVSFTMITLLFAMMFKILPETEVKWRDVWVAALFTSLFFNLGKELISLYLSRSAIESSFGAAASLAVLLIWVYYSSQIFLFGAEFSQVFRKYRRAHLE